MENLSLLEIKSVKEKNNKSSLDYNYANSNAFGFLTAVKSNNLVYKTRINDITDSFYQGNYDINTDYTIIYLYDYQSDGESKDFIAMWGGELHSKTSSNITVLTYFSTEVAKNWQNVHNRNKIGYGDNNDPLKVTLTIDFLKREYGVSKLPSIVIVKTDESKNEESFVLPLDGLKKEAIKDLFFDVIDRIDKHCEEEFDVIKDSILGPDGLITKGRTINNIRIEEFFDDLLKKDPDINARSDLADEMGIDTKTLYNKILKRNGKLTRDECFFIAVRFGLSIKKLNWLLRDNDHTDIGMGGRDGIIYKALIDKTTGLDNVYKVNDLLIKSNEKGIISEKSYLLKW